MTAPTQGVDTKTAQKSLERDIEQIKNGELQNVTPKNDNKKHPDQSISAAVASMSFAGFTAVQACNCLRISAETLYRHYRDEWENGHSNMVNQISGSLAQRALAGSDTAAIFLLKARGRGQFNERQTVDLNASVTVSHKAELLQELSGLLTRGIVIDVEPEPEPEKKEGTEVPPSASAT